MKRVANKITGADAGELARLVMREPRAAPAAQFRCWAKDTSKRRAFM